MVTTVSEMARVKCQMDEELLNMFAGPLQTQTQSQSHLQSQVLASRWCGKT